MGGVKVQRLRWCRLLVWCLLMTFGLQVTLPALPTAALPSAQSAWPPAEVIPPCSRGTMANDRTERRVDLANAKGAHYGFAYDRSVTVTTPLGDHTLFVYDAHGRLLAITAADGRQTQYLYGAFEQPAQVIDALGRHTAFAYDIEGNLTARTNGVSVRWNNSGGSVS